MPKKLNLEGKKDKGKEKLGVCLRGIQSRGITAFSKDYLLAMRSHWYSFGRSEYDQRTELFR